MAKFQHDCISVFLLSNMNISYIHAVEQTKLDRIFIVRLVKKCRKFVIFCEKPEG